MRRHPTDPDITESAYVTMMHERDRIDADIAKLLQSRDALDVLIGINRRYFAELTSAPVPG